MNNNLTVDGLLNNLEIYKKLCDLINNLNSDEKIINGSAYLRVSTDMQTEFSPEAQLEDIIKYCIEKKYGYLKKIYLLRLEYQEQELIKDQNFKK